MNEWERQRKEFQDKYHNNDHEALMNLLDYGDLINLQANTYTDRAIKAESKLRAIGEIIKIPDVWNHLDPIKAVREIIEASIDSDSIGKESP